MKLWVMSDLHAETSAMEFHIPEPWPDHDVVVLAGDIDSPPSRAIEWAAEIFTKPIVYVAGNHEFYGYTFLDEIERARKVAARRRVHFLEQDSVKIGYVRFFGCTLWSDFALQGDSLISHAMVAAKRDLKDFQSITYSEEPGRHGAIPTRFNAMHSRKLATASRMWLKDVLPRFDEPIGTEKIVVVTHNAPHPRSIPMRFERSMTNAWFTNDMSDVIQDRRIDLWVHGHIHNASDYMLGETRVVENSHGYDDGLPGFDFHKVIEI